MALGGILGSRFRPGLRLWGLIAHLVGGLVFGMAAADLMPAASSDNHPLGLVIGFCLGFSLLIVVNNVLDDPHEIAEKNKSRPIIPLLIPFLVDSLIDGLVVGISPDVGSQGWVIPLAVALEMGLASLGLATLLRRGGQRWRSSLGGGLMALTYLVGLISSTILAKYLTGPYLTGLLAFGTAALIYLVVEEVMKEAHAMGEDDSSWVNLAFFFGILMVWLRVILST